MQSSYYLPFTHFAVVRSLLCDWKILTGNARSLSLRVLSSGEHRNTRWSKALAKRLFLTFKAPFRPLSAGALYHLVSSRVSKLSIQIPSRGPHSLRHACAEHLMAEGSHSKRLVITSDTVAPMQLGSMPRWT